MVQEERVRNGSRGIGLLIHVDSFDLMCESVTYVHVVIITA